MYVNEICTFPDCYSGPIAIKIFFKTFLWFTQLKRTFRLLLAILTFIYC